jgi:hypothetical protein
MHHAPFAFDVFSMCVITVIQFDARLQSLFAHWVEKFRNQTTIEAQLSLLFNAVRWALRLWTFRLENSHIDWCNAFHLEDDLHNTLTSSELLSLRFNANAIYTKYWFYNNREQQFCSYLEGAAHFDSVDVINDNHPEVVSLDEVSEQSAHLLVFATCPKIQTINDIQ